MYCAKNRATGQTQAFLKKKVKGMNEDFAVTSSRAWRAGGAGGGFLKYARLGMQVRQSTCGTSRRQCPLSRLLPRSLGRFDPIRGPHGLRHGPKRKLVVASLIGTLKPETS